MRMDFLLRQSENIIEKAHDLAVIVSILIQLKFNLTSKDLINLIIFYGIPLNQLRLEFFIYPLLFSLGIFVSKIW